MNRIEAITLLECSAIEAVGTLAATTEPSVAKQLQRYIDAYDMAIAALQETPGCTGCRWWGVRPQKCSCCRRNANMKDNYEVKA